MSEAEGAAIATPSLPFHGRATAAREESTEKGGGPPRGVPGVAGGEILDKRLPFSPPRLLWLILLFKQKTTKPSVTGNWVHRTAGFLKGSGAAGSQACLPRVKSHPHPGTRLPHWRGQKAIRSRKTQAHRSPKHAAPAASPRTADMPQELREKQNLAAASVSEVLRAVGQLALLWPTGT